MTETSPKGLSEWPERLEFSGLTPGLLRSVEIKPVVPHFPCSQFHSYNPPRHDLTLILNALSLTLLRSDARSRLGWQMTFLPFRIIRFPL